MLSFDRTLLSISDTVLGMARAKKVMIVTAESCTGGLIAGLLTEIAGSSDVVERGLVTYSNEAKMELLGVPFETIRDHGAVSEETARAMATGALARTPRAGLSIAVTGIAGPGGGSAEKPVGLVHGAVATADGRVLHRRWSYGEIGRNGVRAATVRDALDLAREALA